jgi:hypothetical protein
VLAAGILDGVLIAIAVSVAELLLRVARPRDAILGLVPGLAGMQDIDDYPQAQTLPGLVVYRYDADAAVTEAARAVSRDLGAGRGSVMLSALRAHLTVSGCARCQLGCGHRRVRAASRRAPRMSAVEAAPGSSWPTLRGPR